MKDGKTPSADAGQPRQQEQAQEAVDDERNPPSKEKHKGPREKGLKIIFLSSDTGGGHRASSESLAKQFQIYFPGSTYEIIDVLADSCFPYNASIPAYKHLSQNPMQWKLVYEISNSRAHNFITDMHMAVMSEERIRKRILSLEPDAVVSVHPLMTNVPQIACRNISRQTGKRLPIYTVVTDLGSAHCTWFSRGCDKMYIASEQIRNLAQSRGKVKEQQIVMTGLPIRHDFAVEAEALGGRTTPEGQAYQKLMRQKLDIDSDRRVVLLMGGGEGVGSLASVAEALYIEFVLRGVDAAVLVVCGRNKVLKEELATKDWDGAVEECEERSRKRHTSQMKETCFSSTVVPMDLTSVVPERCFAPGVVETFEKLKHAPTKLILPLVTSNSNLEAYGIFSSSRSPVGSLPITPEDSSDEEIDEEKSLNCGDAVSQSIVIGDSDDFIFDVPPNTPKGKVDVIGLGFITNMAEYMVATDILVSKAGPGTIAEAASVGLPVMLTNYLPGQEEGNVSFVVDGQFGEYCDKPPLIAKTLADWLTNPEKLAEMSLAATACGKPMAAAEIAMDIGDQVLHIMDQNECASNISLVSSSDEEQQQKPLEPIKVQKHQNCVKECSREEETVRAEAANTIMNASSLLDLAALDSS
eukprot:CAMPEP_0113309152 /NCGR_PEP_ID=MMETSP0010_2-20120614/7311_1 /TAXON_ID=216773 ORGANISM="Corethron hystrix, Strain 308" /NCGR_SAMPLE_ID=MMETSP0010_2 /ASSEMBLY_ACC=CAM_ASM_000155 /LENGTH=638 /DNA_ID=CAMNT_0000164349 /DNA_START=60 /DNA_END=1976 /DNA_ORIENTATION=- /assembly_acc=CAM_ASM_000155